MNDRIWTISVVPTLAPSMIASAGTRLTSPSAVNELVIRAVAVLLCKQRGEADARRKGREAVVQRFRQQQAQIGTERAQNSAVDHVQAPQQQCHATHQIEKNEASHQLLLPDLSSNVQAIAKCRRINRFLAKNVPK